MRWFLLGEQLFNDIFCSKSDQWAHEEEWRIVNKLTEDELNEYKGKGILRNLSDLGLEITTVYLGCNISAENKQVITAKVNALNSSRQIKIQQANISKTQYKLEFS